MGGNNVRAPTIDPTPFGHDMKHSHPLETMGSEQALPYAINEALHLFLEYDRVQHRAQHLNDV